MNNQRIVLIVSAIAGIIGTYLPCVESYSYKFSFIESCSNGYIIIFAFIISIVVALIGNPKETIINGHVVGTIITSIIPAIILLLLVFKDIKFIRSTLFGSPWWSFDIGFYIIVISSLSILVFGLALNDNITSISNTSQVNNTLFCSGCGKKYSARSAGEFCDECGNKL